MEDAKKQTGGADENIELLVSATSSSRSYDLFLEEKEVSNAPEFFL